MYTPQPVRTPAGAVAALLGEHARGHALTVYAGAGVSAADPTLLPGASRLARLIFDALASHVDLSSLEGDDQWNLLKVADTVSALPMGTQLLRRTLLKVADLRGATENFAHQALALLLCEGAAAIIETNYDDCIERAAQPERPPVVRTGPELLAASGPALLKAHGCVTQPDTMLITSAELAAAPKWATAQVAARLRQHPVVFLGIGSVADYVGTTIKEIYDEVGTGHLLVVDPAMANWETDNLAWKALLPDLAPEHRDPRTAEEFCDALLRAYVSNFFTATSGAVEAMQPEHPQRAGVQAFLSAFDERDAGWVLRWLRDVAFRLEPGSPVVGSSESVKGALAISALAGEQASVRCARHGIVHVQSTAGESAQVMLLAAFGTTLGSNASAEARRRVARARGQDLLAADADVIVVLVGHTGQVSSPLSVEPGHRVSDVLAAIGGQPQALPDDLVAEAAPGHIVHGVAAGNVWLIDGHRLIEAA